MVGSRDNNYEALKEICERFCVRRLDLHGLTSTGEDIPDAQTELDLLVEFFPMSEIEHAKIHFILEKALGEFFGRKIGLLRTDDIKLEYIREVLTRRRTLLYAAEDQDVS